MPRVAAAFDGEAAPIAHQDFEHVGYFRGVGGLDAACRTHFLLLGVPDREVAVVFWIVEDGAEGCRKLGALRESQRGSWERMGNVQPGGSRVKWRHWGHSGILTLGN